MLSAIRFNLDQPKILSSGNVLRVKGNRMRIFGKKKMRISPFPAMFSKAFSHMVIKLCNSVV